MVVQILINDVDVKGYLAPGTLSFTDEINQRSVKSFTLVAPTYTISANVGDRILFQNTDPSSIYFQGTVDSVDKLLLGEARDDVRYEIETVDLHQIPDRTIVAGAFKEKTIFEIVYTLFATFLEPEGMTVGKIDGKDIDIKGAVFVYESLTSVFDKICAKTGYIWYIDPDKKFYLIERETDDSEFNIDEDGNLRDLSVYDNREGYRNMQYILDGSTKTDTQTEYFMTDGQAISWKTVYPVLSGPDDNIHPLIYVDGVPQDVGYRLGRAEGETYDFYWSLNSNVIDATGIFDLGKEIKIEYTGKLDVIGLVQDTNEIANRVTAEGGLGRYAHAESHPEANTEAEVIEIADERIREFAKFGSIVSFNSDLKYVPGTIAEINLPSLDVDATSILITSVELNDRETNRDVWTYHVEATTASVGLSWEKFFRDWLSEKKKIMIGTAADVVTTTLLWEKTWLEHEYPNPFYKIDVDDEVDVSGAPELCEEDYEDIKYIEWSLDDVIVGRRYRTIQDREETKIRTIFNLMFDDANGNITDLSIIGGYHASLTLGTGSTLDTKEHLYEKTIYENIQIVRIDYKGW